MNVDVGPQAKGPWPPHQSWRLVVFKDPSVTGAILHASLLFCLHRFGHPEWSTKGCRNSLWLVTGEELYVRSTTVL